ncbi:rhodanese-like domain-containing protein [Thermostichus vulcanus]|uniref:Rhodanese-like domain-containing protein n=1 Tax=Thermostichus vulcanus str. 'Rupite' TaxID=2813851 RepID=A0ABT0C9Z9_THEVL|nr:rhodanese-like domain-containing protein [Thermostichus vulcanus]MCJ2542614.1 rhodanese-like domain-containing protein [Thermostichus vulcanus str. 'Rupite']
MTTAPTPQTLSQQEQDPRLKEIDALTLKQWLDQGRVKLIDVREPSEYAEERIPGAINMPLSTFDPTQVPASTPEQPVVMQCRMGSRSIQASCQLLDKGWPEVINLKGGIEAWKSAKLPVTRTRNAPISLMRQVQIAAGSLVLLGTLLGAWVNPAWLLLSGFVGAGLVFAGVTNTCGMALLLARMPWNRGQSL